MGIGLFGKVPQKADFVALNLPPTILHPLEQWLEAAVAESRAVLGEQWLNAFLVSPIWRFWIGQSVFGQGCCGAVMPSVDAVGRYFPLVLLAWNADGSAPASPLIDPANEWYGAVEERLLSVLRTEGLPELAGLIEGLDEPARATAPPPAETTEQSCWWQGSQANGADEILVHSGLPAPGFYAELIRPRVAN